MFYVSSTPRVAMFRMFVRTMLYVEDSSSGAVVN